MAVEAGARLSGMEFSSYYTLAPAHSTMTRSMMYLFGSYFDADGNELDPGFGKGFPRPLAKAMVRGPVFARLDKAPEDIRRRIHLVQPNFRLPFDRRGIDPFTDLFEVTLHGEGTIRGVGGIVVAGTDCRTDVPGLFVAGDVASRENIVGAVSGGGAPNSAWAVSSGTWAGRAAVRHARSAAADAVLSAAGRAWISEDVTPIVRDELNSYDKNMFRTEIGLRTSESILDDLWQRVHDRPGAADRNAVRARESAALVAMGRWVKASARQRRETRGMHWRTDHPAQDPQWTRRIVIDNAKTEEVA
jgi:succinate dehydrogenase/fumarate reductase flavoprotein subunit